MYNIIEIQNKLKGFSKEQLMQIYKSGTAPQYMVVSELNRRKNMESDYARREATDNTNTVAQEVITGSGVPQGGIAQLASAMNAKTDNTQNTGVKQMAEGGVVKMQTAGKPPSVMSNIMSLMSPPSYDIADISKNEAIAPFLTPKETGLEAIEGEFLEEEQRKAVELQQAVLKTAKTGKTVGEIAKLLEIEVKDAANIIAGSAAYILTQTGGFLPQIYGIAQEANEKGSGLESIKLGKTIRVEGKEFAFKDGLLLPRITDYNPFDERAKLFNKKTEEQLEEEERLRIKRAKFASMGALAEFDKPTEMGGKEGTAASESIFSEGAPVEFLKGTPTSPVKPLPVGPKDSFDEFGNPVHSIFTSGFPRKLDQVGSPMTNTGLDNFAVGTVKKSSQPGDEFPAGPGVGFAPVSASRPSVAEEISRLGKPIQTSMTQPPAINTEGDSDDTLFTNVSRADEPFKLSGKALEEAEAKKAAQIKELLASETTPVPFRVGPAEMSRKPDKNRDFVADFESSVYDFDPANQREATLTGSMPESEDMKQQVLSEILKSYEPKGQYGRLAPIPKYDEFGDSIQPPERIQGIYPYSLTMKDLEQRALPTVGIPNYADAMSDLTGRAEQYYKDAYAGRLDQSPEEVYGDLEALQIDPKFREEPPALQDYFSQTLENQQKAMPGGGGSSGLGALFAQTLENQQEGIPGGADPNAKPTFQSRFDRARLYLEGLGEDMSGMTQEDVINFAKKAGMKSLEVLDQVTDFGAEKFNDIQEFYRNRKDENAARLREENLSPPDPEKTGEDTEVNELIEILKNQQAATAKQSGASSAALSEYLGGLEKDKEFDKAMALANAGAALMMPSATFGEGASKAIKAGTSTLQKGKNSYNKNKLQVLALQGRIDAAKATAASRSAVTGATLSSRILLAQREDLQRQLEILAPMGVAPDGRAKDKADELKRQIKEKDEQLNSMIMTASLGGTSPSSDNIYANYNLTS